MDKPSDQAMSGHFDLPTCEIEDTKIQIILINELLKTKNIETKTLQIC